MMEMLVIQDLKKATESDDDVSNTKITEKTAESDDNVGNTIFMKILLRVMMILVIPELWRRLLSRGRRKVAQATHQKLSS